MLRLRLSCLTLLTPIAPPPQSTAAVGEDILSGAYARREEQAALAIADLKARLAKAEAQVRRGGDLKGRLHSF